MKTAWRETKGAKLKELVGHQVLVCDYIGQPVVIAMYIGRKKFVSSIGVFKLTLPTLNSP
jgi:hypothetical protein